MKKILKVKMNKNARELYDDLMAGRLIHFDMHLWGTGNTGDPMCNSPQCIGGTCEARMIDRKISTKHFGLTPQRDIAAWLGINNNIASYLFWPSGWTGEENSHPWYFGRFIDGKKADSTPYSATQAEAAQALIRAVLISNIENRIQSL